MVHNAKRGENNSISDNQALALLVGTMIGITLTIARDVVEEAKQGAWISVIIGGLYPVLLSLLAVYLCNKHPEQDILKLNEIYFGKYLGLILNFIFFLRFSVYMVFALYGFQKVIRVYATPFLSPSKIYIGVLALVIFTDFSGFKALARINEISLILVIIMTAALSGGLTKGNYLYLMPIIDRNLYGILKAVKDTLYYYSGIEIVFLIYPYIGNKQNLLKISLKASLITIGINTFMVIMSIYYLGYKLVNMSLWPVLLITEFTKVQIINVSRYVFLILWSIAIFKRIANEYYGCGYILKHMFKVKNNNIFYIISLPAFLIILSYIRTYAQRAAIIKVLSPIIAIVNLTCIFLLVARMFLKSRKAQQKQ